MKKLPISTIKFNHKKLIVDNDVYEKLKDERIICFKNGNIHSIRIGRPYKIPSENLDVLIIPHNPRTHGFNFLNGDDFDRRRCNIKLVRRNILKTRERHVYQNKYKGVYWYKKRRCYVSNIFINGMTCYLGSFNKDEDAALIYDAACRYLFEESKYYINIPNKTIELSADLKNKIDNYLLKQVS